MKPIQDFQARITAAWERIVAAARGRWQERADKTLLVHRPGGRWVMAFDDAILAANALDRAVRPGSLNLGVPVLDLAGSADVALIAKSGYSIYVIPLRRESVTGGDDCISIDVRAARQQGMTGRRA